MNLMKSESSVAYEIQVLNFGTYNGVHTVPIDENGTMFTGDTGEGKTTMVDAFSTLFQGTRARYNVAAAQENNKKDRNIISYIRGDYANNDGDISCLRPSTVKSGVSAKFKFESGRIVTAMMLFSINGTSREMSKLKRHMIIFDAEVNLQTIASELREDTKRFNTFVKNISHSKVCDNYEEYIDRLYRHLNIDNKNAGPLLTRALGLKQVNNVTNLLTELVLEDGNIKGDIENSVEEFASLQETDVAIHDAEEQIQKLGLLKSEYERYLQAQDDVAINKSDDEYLEPFNANAFSKAFKAHISKAENHLAELQTEIADVNTQMLQSEDTLDAYKAEYNQKGGDRIKTVEQAVEYEEKILSGKLKNFDKYTQLTNHLKLGSECTEVSYNRNIQAANDEQQRILPIKSKLEEERDEKLGTIAPLKVECSQIQSELDELKGKRSNVDIKYQNHRDAIADLIGLTSEDLPFVAELLDVQDEHRKWQGAIERALSGKKLQMLVPEAYSKEVSEYVNSNHLGVFFKYVVVKESAYTQPVNFKSGGILQKLKWKDSSFTDWLKSDLARIDLQCVDINSLRSTEYSITVEGQIQYNKGRFEKDDRASINDKRRWSLGFTNEVRIAALSAELSDKADLIVKYASEAAQMKATIDGFAEKQRILERLLETEWDSINYRPSESKLESLNAQYASLKESLKDIESLREKIEETKVSIAKLRNQKDELNKKLGSAEDEYQKSNDVFLTLNGIAQDYDDASSDTKLRLEGKLPENLKDEYASIQELSRLQQKHLSDLQKEYAAERRGLEEEIRSSKRNTLNHMRGFKQTEKWIAIASEWGVEDVDYARDYVAYHDKLVDEDLPKEKERFRFMLDTQATSSMKTIRSRIRYEIDKIDERIDQVNSKLKPTNFREGTYLEISMEVKQAQELKDILNDIDKIQTLRGSYESDEAKNKQLLKNIFDKLKVVDGFFRDALNSPDKKLSKEVLDVRNQVEFTVKEIERETGASVDSYGSKGSAGKSGGEKESFSGVILAAALSYVLTPEGASQPAYRSVFLDEAFSNTSTVVAKRVAKVFAEMGLHLNIVTPYKNIEIAREACSSVVVAQKSPETKTSSVIVSNWKQIDKLVA